MPRVKIASQLEMLSGREEEGMGWGAGQDFDGLFPVGLGLDRLKKECVKTKDVGTSRSRGVSCRQP
jgi:hypothetical protein